MDPLILSVLAASAAIKKTDTVELLKDWITRRNQTDLGEELPQFEPHKDELKSKRVETLKKLNALRNRVVLCITESETQQSLWRILVEQALAIYDAKDERTLEDTLELVDESLNQIASIVETYEKNYERLKKIRVAAIIISVLALASIVLFLFIATKQGITTSYEVTLLGLPVPVILWSTIGSYTAILYRFSLSNDNRMPNPLAWFFSRPLTGVVMGSITYLIIKVGMLTFAPGTQMPNLGTVQLMWLVAFLAGFSDRFSDSLLRTLIGKLGGDKDGEIVSMEITTSNQKNGSWESILNLLNRRKAEQSSTNGSSTPKTPTEGVNGTKPKIETAPVPKLTESTPGAASIQMPEEGEKSGLILEESTVDIKIKTEKPE